MGKVSRERAVAVGDRWQVAGGRWQVIGDMGQVTGDMVSKGTIYHLIKD